jgi:hypothetical protein
MPPELAADLTSLEVELTSHGFRVYTPAPGPLAQRIAVHAAPLGLQIDAIATLEPTLEDVYLSITTQRRVSQQAAEWT